MMARTSQDLVRQWISHYITHLRDAQPLLTGHDIETMGFQPGPVYREILDALLYARLDGRVVSVEDERAFVQKKYDLKF